MQQTIVIAIAQLTKHHKSRLINESRGFVHSAHGAQKKQSLNMSISAQSFMSLIYDRLTSIHRTRLDLSLHLLFTPWQVAILTKRAQGVRLTPAENQELSRRIKPKILAIDDLRDIKLLLPFFS